MTLRRAAAAFVMLAGAHGAGAVPLELPAPEELVRRSIAYHDPQGVWESGEIQLTVRTVYSETLAESRGIAEKLSEIRMAPARGYFRYFENVGEDRVEYTIEGGVGRIAVNDSEVISEEDRERLRIRTPELYRDYFEYMFGMPMKLRDPGTRLGPVGTNRFGGDAVYTLRVTYDPEVGEDVWTYYFDRETYALVGTRFYHDEEANDGEYIVHEGEIADGESGLRLPQARAWYYNTDGAYLATDEITGLQVLTEEEAP